MAGYGASSYPDLFRNFLSSRKTGSPVEAIYGSFCGVELRSARFGNVDEIDSTNQKECKLDRTRSVMVFLQVSLYMTAG